MEQGIKNLIFHFSNGTTLPIEIGNYIIQFEVAGMFIKEKVKSKSVLVTPTQETRTVMFFQMSNIDYIEFEYYD